MPPAFAISGLSLHNPPHRSEWQDVLATLALEYGPVLLTGVQLVRLSTGELRIWIPRVGRASRAMIRGREARDTVLTLACNAYRAITGRDPADTPVAKAFSSETDTFHESA